MAGPQKRGPVSMAGAEEAVRGLLRYAIGEDPVREGLLETPKRVARAWIETWAQGYTEDPAELLKTFQDGSEGYNEMVVVRDIPVYSHCEHHLAPFFGTAVIAYLPDKKIVGLSKLVRVVRAYSQRLQVQERLTTEIADCVNQGLEPRGVGVLVQCRHLCMESRGVGTPGALTLTNALRGVFLEDDKIRAEFMSLRK